MTLLGALYNLAICMTKWMNERENLCCRYIFMLIMYCLIVSFLLYLGNIQDCCAVGHGDFSK